MPENNIPEWIETEDASLEEIIAGLPKLLVPLYESGSIALVTNYKHAEQILYSVGAWQDLQGHGGLAQHIQNDVTGENIFLLGVFRDEVGIIAHEACHVTFIIHNFIGENISKDTNNEPFCYLLQRIVDWAYVETQGAWDETI